MAENPIDTAKKEIIGGPVGTFRHSLDPKKRLTIPSECRAAMGEPEYVYVYPHMTKECLNIISPQEMAKLMAKLDEASIFDSEAADIRAAFGESAQMIKIDTAGRIRINDELMEFAGISGKVTLKGAVRNIEVWASAKLPADGAKKLDIKAAREAMAKIAALAGGTR